MNYKLNRKDEQPPRSPLEAWRTFSPLMHSEGKNLTLVGLAILVNTGSNLLAPIIIGHTIDTYILSKNFSGVLMFAGALLVVYAAGLVASYVQTRTMGGVARRVLFNLRNALFTKLQELPIAFFNQNKAGDLISRINNDTDVLNQFFAQALMQFLGSFFLVLGAGVFLLTLNFKLGGAALLPALVILIITQLLSNWVKQKNAKSLRTIGSMSGEIQESLSNFKVVVAFNRLDYFTHKFSEANKENYKASIAASIANTIFTPIYTLASSMSQLIVICFGIYLVQNGSISLGVLIGFLLYTNNFYSPLRQLASIWSTLQQALAAFDRISEVLTLTSDTPLMPRAHAPKEDTANILALVDVSFTYPDGKQVLQRVSMALDQGKTYALVGPTGGGKTTTALLMARLYDPTHGTVLLNGHDIRSVDPTVRTQAIGFILQEPFLFSGTVRDNIIYGNPDYLEASPDKLNKALAQANLLSLLERFEDGLDTSVSQQGNTLSLGQKQLIAFIRAVLRKPKLLILDEATANIDTVTEQLLEDILQKLPKETTVVIIAHRLNTIANADEIFFVNAGSVTPAGSMENAVHLLLHGERES